MASAIIRTSRISCMNWSGYSDCAPSESASSGFGCTSTMMPSAPAATAPRADLHDVGHLGDPAESVLIHRFGADQQAGFFTRLSEETESWFAESLKRIGRAAGLPRAASENDSARVLYLSRCLDDLALTLDGAGA